MNEQKEETTVETTTDAFLTSEGCLLIPTDLPAGTVITITIQIGGAQPEVKTEPAPQRQRYMTGGRAINGGQR